MANYNLWLSVVVAIKICIKGAAGTKETVAPKRKKETERDKQTQERVSKQMYKPINVKKRQRMKLCSQETELYVRRQVHFLQYKVNAIKMI